MNKNDLAGPNGGTLQADMLTLAQLAAAQTVQEMERRTRKQEQGRMLHNAAALMEHYLDLKAFPQLAISEAEEARAAGTDVQGDGFVESVRTSKVKTAIMVAHIDAALRELEHDAAQRGVSYKFRAFRGKYIEGKTYEQIAEEMNAGKNSPARWCKDMNAQLAVKLFGVDGLRKW